ncbi:MAG: RNA-binding S4 domain-containing protein [Proteobacteria bacterium]|nr:RNA-binding S4 domain-containing protein [Pseudomonadota bacterium]MBU1714306.1 RNA-binding S4 domain-containing protein [Pseudomonadota bacterium]
MENKVRIDKWLWAARFFKTRSTAAQAVAGGKVQVNGERVKPAKVIEVGNELRIRRGIYEYVVLVLGLSDKRRSAKEAQLLYAETEKSVAAREQKQEENRLFSDNRPVLRPQRPSKRDRRLIRSFTQSDE